MEWQQYVMRGNVHWGRIRNAAMGWGAPKLRLCRQVAYAPDGETAKNMVAAADLDRAVVLETAPPGASRPDAPVGGEGPLKVDSFTFNRLDASVHVASPGGAWLYYADSYHPGWKAWVNGKPTPVVRANLAFKAVRLNEGDNRVRLVYSDGLRGLAARALALVSLAFAAGLMFSMIRFAVSSHA